MRGIALRTAFSCGLVLAICGLALGIGTSSVDLSAVFHPDPVLIALRLPRVLMALGAGAALAASGVALQGLLRNPLADPYVVGVSGGAALGGVVALAWHATSAWTLTGGACVGAMVSVAILLALTASAGRTDPWTLLLAGTLLNTFAAAVVTLMKTLVTASQAQEILFWLMGSLSSPPPGSLIIFGLCIAPSLAVLLMGCGALNLLTLGDEEALAQGLPVTAARLILFLAASVLVGTVVTWVGMVAFVGLVIPHTLRFFVGDDYRRLLPASLVGGACFLVGADALARLTFFIWGTEMPVGVMTAGMGGPFFLYLLLFKRQPSDSSQ